MNNCEQWLRLLSNRRLGDARTAEPGRIRTDFQVDHDRIVFSSAFRRLQDKTQVFPLADSDYVRTRLTHSIEVSCIGRSLGTQVGEVITAKYGIDTVQPADFGAIVAAACLAHDIGNPPFGHSGEDAIRHWFEQEPPGQRLLEPLGEQQRADLLRFEGNAQGFRILTRLQSPDNPGLRLTHAVLAAFTKYPCRSGLESRQDGISGKKHGFFHAEEPFFVEVAEATGLRERVPGAAWDRHPLAFLVEAADDISYHIIDFEDGFRQGCIDYSTAIDHLSALVDRDLSERLSGIAEPKRRVEYLRAAGIGSLVNATARAFLDQEEAILRGEFDRELVGEIPQADALESIKRFAISHIYTARPVVEIEAAGFEVLGGLLDVFAGAAHEVATRPKPSRRARKLLELVPAQFLGEGGEPAADPYQRLLGITDFIAGMTDTYAVATFKKVRGISLPHA
ncbi:deoxyguanosinetriphosphate triphosphohydrolase [Thiohalomonas denitrificans]|uniref:dGTPase n=1 Tax=Thiohalomonas denitrificans TaxID=415747 RepID=A0A1G5QRI9_9GAMM|nr:deoxyguanosinetriphosphate triphosphohydrolase [Thiohalomonas denitrificans]SCZ64256.1 dGTPase [Thiohalomonas denitrificans]